MEYITRNVAFLGLEEAVSNATLQPAEALSVIAATQLEFTQWSLDDDIADFLNQGIKSQSRFANLTGHPLGFSALNGTVSSLDDVMDVTLPTDEIKTLELFSDGYSSLPKGQSIKDWETEHQAVEQSDFHKVGPFRSVKGSTKTEYFDDRSVIWAEWAIPLTKTVSEIRSWIVARDPGAIWLCGAGTSAFIGDALATGLDRRLAGIPVRAIPSTDLVARPFDYIREGQRPLVVSFGRSGDSSKSIGTLDILDRLAPNADRLHITCNKDSALATRQPAGLAQQRVIVLPEVCHDQGFAMTSSYTAMLLTALACLSDTPVEQIAGNLTHLADQASAFLESDLTLPRPKRVVFLGAGPFLGTARESALKVLELTAGRVVTSWDSTLGFRHGPKAIVDDNTVVVVFLSNDVLTRKYDADIVDEIRKQFPASTLLPVGARQEGHTAPDIELNAHDEDIWDTALYILVAQRLSVAWSKDLGLNVDNPFEGGNLTRVVSNVSLYT